MLQPGIMREGCLAGTGDQLRRLDLHADHRSFQVLPPQVHGNPLRLGRDPGRNLFPCDQVPPEGHPVGHGFDLRHVAPLPDGIRIQSVGIHPERFTAFAQKRGDIRPGLPRKVSDGMDSLLSQQVHRSFPGKHQVRYRKRPENLPVIIAQDHCGRVRFFIVRTHLGKNLVARDADGDCNPDFLPHPAANAVRQFSRCHPVIIQRAGHIKI